MDTATETPTDLLRRAASLMRERAGGCQPRRWHWEALGEKRYPQRVSSDGNVAIIAETFIDPAHRPFEAEHIASWSPPIALAVAELLDRIAWMGELDPDSLGRVGCDEAVAVARAYLGEASDA
jgi:hypothetical protein